MKNMALNKLFFIRNSAEVLQHFAGRSEETYARAYVRWYIVWILATEMHEPDYILAADEGMKVCAEKAALSAEEYMDEEGDSDIFSAIEGIMYQTRLVLTGDTMTITDVIKCNQRCTRAALLELYDYAIDHLLVGCMEEEDD